MNWYKAKNLILISLVALNISLIMLILVTRNNYTLTNVEIENVNQVLSSKYNIGIYAELPKDYRPLKEIEMINEGYNNKDILYDVFIGDEQNIHKLEENDKITFQGDNKTLIMQAGDFILTVNDGLSKNREDVLKELSKSGHFNDFYLYETIVNDDTTIYDYRQKFKGQTIYSNFLMFEEKDSVITKVEGYYAKPNRFIGDEKEIVSVDLALFTLANFYPKLEDEQIFIDSINLVYNQEEVTNEPDVVLKATPCYLIKIKGNQMPVKIDAYTNTVITN